MEGNIKAIISCFQISGLQAASITFFSSYFLDPSLPLFVISSSPPATKEDQISRWILFVL